VAKGYPIDVHVAHEYLWTLVDRRGVARVDHADLMAEFLCTKTTASRLMRRLVDEGRLRQLSRGRQRKGNFVIEDPSRFSSSVSELETGEEE
jgi:hypothetical protein